MYAEIQEAMGYIGSKLYGRIPRRKVGLLEEVVGNGLLDRYRILKWDASQPSLDSEARALKIQFHGETDPLLGDAAASLCLGLDELLEALPHNVKVYIDPGDVAFVVGLHGHRQKIGSGQSLVLKKDSGPTTLPGDDASRPRLRLSKPISLKIGPDGNLDPVVGGASESPWPVFQAAGVADVKFTVASFATTRFGSCKQKSSLSTLKNLREKVTENGLPSASSSPPDSLPPPLFNNIGPGGDTPALAAVANVWTPTQAAPAPPTLDAPQPPPHLMENPLLNPNCILNASQSFPHP